MAHYTITIKTLIDNNFDFKMTDYPIFDENYRNVLNQKILNHYYENEIGFETAPLFRFYLNNKLNEIMPYYNILYEKQLQLLNNIDKNVNLVEDFKGTNTNESTTNTESESTSNSNGTSKNKNLFQDTPQGNLNNTELENQTWATNYTMNNTSNENKINDNSSSNGTANSNGTNNYLKTIIGNNGGRYNLDILADLQKNLMNIDLLIISDLYDLFMGLY
ncbi:MAG: hypothetical protein MR985_02440 [Mollicutes bacterium]|nr:hypothetical protein [Mollicutes bacterium]